MSYFINHGNGSSDGKIKVSDGDVLAYLEDKIDGVTLQSVADIIVAKSLSGMTVSVNDLNMLQGVTSNVQNQINQLSSIVNFVGVSDTHENLLTNFTSGRNKDMAIVLDDETKLNATTIYVHNGTNWIYSGKFDVKMRDFTSNPIDLTTEVVGVLPNTNIEELGKIGTKLVDESNLLDNTIPVYNATLGKYELVNYVSNDINWDNF